MNWAIVYYSEAVQEDILALPAGFLARYLRYTDRMEIYGPDLGSRTPVQWAKACLNYA